MSAGPVASEGGHPAASTGQAEPSRVKVVYILGSPRCGSTLICNLLGEMAGFFAAGEIRLLWKELATRHCGCGLLAAHCPVWSQVAASVDAAGVVRTSEVVDLMRRTSRMQDLPGILRARSREALPAATRRYASLLGATYTAVATATGARVIVDSSKSVAEAALLRHVPEVEPFIIHLVRDPRAMVHSWHRALAQESTGTPAHPTPSLALRWVLTNVASHAVGKRYRGRELFSTYEELVRRPEDHLADIARMLSEDADLGFLADPAHQSRSRHIVGGNRLRNAQRVVVREDTEWRTKLPARRAVPVTALTLPLLVHYGYPVRRASPPLPRVPLAGRATTTDPR